MKINWKKIWDDFEDWTPKTREENICKYCATLECCVDVDWSCGDLEFRQRKEKEAENGNV